MVMTDKRMFERMGCGFKVEVYNPASYSRDEADICDFSAGGLGLLSSSALPRNDEVEVKIRFSQHSAPVLERAQVAWAKQELRGQWRIGLRFPEIRLSRLMPFIAENSMQGL